MTEVISTRLKKKEIEILNRIAEKEHVDRSALLRKFLIQQINEYNMKDAAEKYRKGLTSMAESATLANVSLYEMMEYCQREKIRPPEPTDTELQREMDQAEKIFAQLK